MSVVGITRIHWSTQEEDTVYPQVKYVAESHPKWSIARVMRKAQEVLPASRRRPPSRALHLLAREILGHQGEGRFRARGTVKQDRKFWDDVEYAVFDDEVKRVHASNPDMSLKELVRLGQREIAPERRRPSSGPIMNHVAALIGREQPRRTTHAEVMRDKRERSKAQQKSQKQSVPLDAIPDRPSRAKPNGGAVMDFSDGVSSGVPFNEMLRELAENGNEEVQRRLGEEQRFSMGVVEILPDGAEEFTQDQLIETAQVLHKMVIDKVACLNPLQLAQLLSQLSQN